MKRRLLPILMTLVLVCALPIWAAFVTSGDVTNPLVSTAGATLPDLQAKIDAAEDNATITLDSDTTITETLVITGKTLTLDLNGYVLKMGGTGRVIHIIKSHGYDVKVEIKDGEPGKEHTGEYAALPAGGVITGGKADKGGGILLDGGCTLKLTGGCITDCHATDTGGGVYVDNNATLKMTGGCITDCHASYGGGGIFSYENLYMSGTAKIEKCTSNGGSDDAIWNSGGVIYADGGTVDGMVNSQGTITCSNGTNANAATVFNKTVYLRGSNQTKRCIEAGTYNGTVENTGSITGGTFYGTVRNQKNSMGLNITGSVTGGTFYGPIVNEVGPGQVTGGTFAVTFDRGDGTKTGPELVGYKGTVSRPPSDPEKSGHTFTGWYLGDEKYNFDTPVTTPLTLTAKWEKVPSSGGYYYYHPTTDTKTTDTKGSPKTFDAGIALYVGMALTSAAGVAFVGKKRED